MKKQDINHLEAILAAVFRSGKDLHPTPEWRAEVMGAVRRCHAVENIAVNAAMIPLRLMWRLAMVSAAAALLCAALYMAFPVQKSSVIEVPLDSFENAVTAVTKI